MAAPSVVLYSAFASPNPLLIFPLNFQPLKDGDDVIPICVCPVPSSNFEMKGLQKRSKAGGMGLEINSKNGRGEIEKEKKKDHQVRKCYDRNGEVDQPLELSIKKTKKKV